MASDYIKGVRAARAEYLLQAVVRFIRNNPIEHFEVDYDGVACDGLCLATDCEAAAEDLAEAFR